MPSVIDMLTEAVRLHRAGHLPEAEKIYRQVLTIDPKQVDALHLLGLIARQTGRRELAIELLGKSVALKPDFAHAHHNLGIALDENGQHALAAVHHRRAVELTPDHLDARIHFGNALLRERNFAAARVQFEKAVALNPQLAGAHGALGMALRALGDLPAAMTSYRRALELDPKLLAVQVNLGNALREAGRAEEAIDCYRRAVALQPDLAAAHNNLGSCLMDLGRNVEATACFERAVTLRPDYAQAQSNLGRALSDQGRDEEALARHMRALELDPNSADAHANYAFALHASGRRAEAIPHHERALALDPTMAKSRLALCMLQLRVLYDSAAEIEQCRAAYAAALRRLDAETRLEDLPILAEAIGGTLPFYLAYQGMNDRDLQIQHGTLACRAMASVYPPVTVAPPPVGDEPIRVGFVSGYFRHHSVWKIPLKGWLTQLDRKRFRLFGYYTKAQIDGETKIAAAHCDRFVQGPLPLARWRETILADRPHVLIYPEIGMEKITAQLAAQRLAATQCTSWGHPDTSGFPTIDYYLSSALMEPADGEAHYSERLIRLPDLSFYYDPIAVPAMAIERAGLGLRPNLPVYWCGQSLFKYLPQYDEVFPRIAKEVGDCQFVFLEFARQGPVTAQFHARLDRAFAGFGLNAADHCVFLPQLEPSRFLAAMGLCDVFLDSIGWSGCNSTIESLVHDLPIVTHAGSLMRGRHSAAILAMMGIEETVAQTVDDYVATAARLARESAFRDRMRRAIGDGKYRVYHDRAPIAALAAFLETVAGAPPAAALSSAAP